MSRLFGKAKPKVPPPSLTDCISNVRSTNGLSFVCLISDLFSGRQQDRIYRKEDCQIGCGTSQVQGSNEDDA